MSRPRAFSQVDVFSPTAYLGNPVAVVLDAVGLDEPTMQRFARWTNLSETTFVLPATSADADLRLRIFTPHRELPFAGHPTLGSVHAWLEHGGVPRLQAGVVLECAAGLVEVRRLDGRLAFAAPPTLRSGELEPGLLRSVAAALGVRPEQVVAHQWVDNGPGWAVIQLATAAEVLALEPDLSTIPDAMVGAIGATPEGSRHAFEMRSFAPGVGVSEDPVCGSMAAAVGQWLARTGVAPERYTISQGARLGRAGEIAITAAPDGALWVGGATATCVRGSTLL